jgi:hypothetical protein
VVAAAITPGLPFANTCGGPGSSLPPEQGWQLLVGKVLSSYTRLAAATLFAFGRAFGASGYGVSACFTTFNSPTCHLGW